MSDERLKRAVGSGTSAMSDRNEPTQRHERDERLKRADGSGTKATKTAKITNTNGCP